MYRQNYADCVAAGDAANSQLFCPFYKFFLSTNRKCVICFPLFFRLHPIHRHTHTYVYTHIYMYMLLNVIWNAAEHFKEKAEKNELLLVIFLKYERWIT